MIYDRVKSMLLHDKTAPLVTTVTALIAFILSLIALLSTSKQGQLGQYSVVRLNTSTLLQNAVKIETNGASVTARGLQAGQTPMPTPIALLNGRQFSLPGASQVNSYLASLGSDLSSAVSPPQSTATASASSGSTESNSLLDGIESFFNSLIGGISGAVSNEIEQVVNTVLKSVLDSLGIQDWYGLYMTGFCDGKFTSSDGMNTTACTSYSDIKGPATGNSTFQLGTTTLDFSALNIPAKLSKSGGQIQKAFTALIALQITGIVSCGILIVLAPLSIVFLNRWLTHLLIAALTTLSATCFCIVALIATSLLIIVSSLVNQLGDGLGIEASSGVPFLALEWISFVFMAYAGNLWVLRWHAHRYVRRGKELATMQRPLVKSAESAFPLS